MLGLLGLVHPDAATAAKSGKCKRKPNECETCKKGKCERKNGKKRCKAGKIKPKAAGTPCTVVTGGSGTCQTGTCIAAAAAVTPALPPPLSPPPPSPPPFCASKPDFTDCGSGKQCSGGVCATPPTCRVGGEPCMANCCAGIPCGADDHCQCAPVGAQCQRTLNCCTGTCVGFICT
jgi:hypothetical protein